MKTIAWVCILALLLCACRKDKEEDYSLNDQIPETEFAAEEVTLA